MQTMIIGKSTNVILLAVLCISAPIATRAEFLAGDKPTRQPELVKQISVANAGHPVAISLDGKLVAAAVVVRLGENVYHRIRLYQVAGGSMVRELSEPVGLIGSLQFSPDGRYLAGGSVKGADRAMQMWRIADGHLVFRIPAIVVPSIQFSSDGNMLAAVDWREVKLYEIPSGKLVRTLTGATENIWAVAMSSDKRFVAAGCYDWSFRVWRVEDGALVHALETGSGPVVGMRFSPSGETLAVSCGYDMRSVQLWGVAEGKKKRTLDYARGGLFRRDGSIFVGDTALGLSQWDVQQGTVAQSVKMDIRGGTQFTLTDQGMLMWAIASDDAISIWRMPLTDRGAQRFPNPISFN